MPRLKTFSSAFQGNHASLPAVEPFAANPLPGPGDVLGSYRLTECLGEGGMGVVYRAEHLRLPRKAAIKILKPALARSSEEVQRFFEEARAVNEVGHRNIVDVTDFVAEPERQLVYMVMESLSGLDLAAYLRQRGALPPAEALEIALPVLDALHAAHRLQIVHRDLKPENVFLHEGADGRVVKLLDFGVAKAFGSRRAAGLTSPGITLGTPRYMAPEQVRAKDLDARTDIYAFGVMLYEMLAGRPPFASEDATEVMISQVREVPPPFATGDGGIELSVSVQQVVLRCLEKHPDKRFQTALAVREALERCPEMLTVTERTPAQSFEGAAVAATEPVDDQRHRRRMLALAGGALLFIALGVIALVLLRPKQERDVKVVLGPAADARAAKPLAATRPATLRTAADARSPSPPPAPGWRRLSVDSTPRGAEVFIDGKLRGRTPLAGLAIARDTTQLRLHRRGFRDHEETLTVGAAVMQRLVRLERLGRHPGTTHGRLRVATSLGGSSQKARVLIDGKVVGETPLTLRVRAGRHVVEVRHAKRRRRRTVVVRGRKRPTILLIPLD